MIDLEIRQEIESANNAIRVTNQKVRLERENIEDLISDIKAHLRRWKMADSATYLRKALERFEGEEARIEIDWRTEHA